jgi:uncharacterized membrane protein
MNLRLMDPIVIALVFGAILIVIVAAARFVRKRKSNLLLRQIGVARILESTDWTDL